MRCSCRLCSVCQAEMPHQGLQAEKKESVGDRTPQLVQHCRLKLLHMAAPVPCARLICRHQHDHHQPATKRLLPQTCIRRCKSVQEEAFDD